MPHDKIGLSQQLVGWIHGRPLIFFPPTYKLGPHVMRVLTGVSRGPVRGEIHVAAGDAAISDFVLQLFGSNLRRLFLFLN